MELKLFVGTIYKRLWLLIILPVITAGLMVFYSSRNYVPIYEARTTLYVVNDGVSRQGSTMQADIETARILVNDYRELIRSKLITGAIINQLNLKDINSDQLSGRITVSAREGTRVIVISAVDENPQTARDIANKTGEAFAQKAVELMRVDNVATIDKASTPTLPINSRSSRNVIIAFLFGIVAAVGIMFFLEYLDDSIKTREDIEKHLGLKVLGIIPVFNIK